MSTSIRNAGADQREQSLGTAHHLDLQIRVVLTPRIERDMAFGDQLLTEEEVCDQFGVSRETFRDAWRGWESDGIISRPRGQATVVERLPPACRQRRCTDLNDFTRFKVDIEATLAKGPPMRQPSVPQLTTTRPDFFGCAASAVRSARGPSARWWRALASADATSAGVSNRAGAAIAEAANIGRSPAH